MANRIHEFKSKDTARNLDRGLEIVNDLVGTTAPDIRTEIVLVEETTIAGTLVGKRTLGFSESISEYEINRGERSGKVILRQRSDGTVHVS